MSPAEFRDRLRRLPHAEALGLPEDLDPAREEDLELAASALLHRFREHDDVAAFTLLFELCRTRLYAIGERITRQLGMAVDPEDLAAGFMAGLFADVRKDQPVVRHILGLAHTTMRNDALNQLRKFKRAQVRHLVYETRHRAHVPIINPALQAEHRERAEALLRMGMLFLSVVNVCFHGLSERDRRILIAREVDELTYDQIAVQLELPRAQVGMILKRARQHLADGIAATFASMPGRSPLALGGRLLPGASPDEAPAARRQSNEDEDKANDGDGAEGPA